MSIERSTGSLRSRPASSRFQTKMSEAKDLQKKIKENVKENQWTGALILNGVLAGSAIVDLLKWMKLRLTLDVCEVDPVTGISANVPCRSISERTWLQTTIDYALHAAELVALIIFISKLNLHLKAKTHPIESVMTLEDAELVRKFFKDSGQKLEPNSSLEKVDATVRSIARDIKSDRISAFCFFSQVKSNAMDDNTKQLVAEFLDHKDLPKIARIANINRNLIFSQKPKAVAFKPDILDIYTPEFWL